MTDFFFVSGNVTNQFLLLSNTQFTECRVHEDSDPEVVEVKPDRESLSKEERDVAIVEKAGQALNCGIRFMEATFVKVEVI